MVQNMTQILTRAQLKKFNTKPKTAAGIAKAKKQWKKLNIVQQKYQLDFKKIEKRLDRKAITLPRAQRDANALFSRYKKNVQRIYV